LAKWILKAAVQKTISLLPNGHKINYLFQKHVTKMRLDDALMDQALRHCADHIRHVHEDEKTLSGLVTLELGTGWYPVVPIGLFLCGAERVVTIDLTPLLRADNLIVTLKKFCEYAERGKLTSGLPGIDAARLRALISLTARAEQMTVDQMLANLHVEYIVDDARQLKLPDESVSLIHSNDVFEHIYPSVLVEILTEFKRVGKKGGLMSHFVDMSDHFFHFDKSISIYNFLRYSEKQWKLIDNSVAPQSRLRVNEYRALYRDAAIPISREELRPGDPQELQNIPLATRFRDMPPSAAAVTHAYLISRLS
jgi:hypothetical protein